MTDIVVSAAVFRADAADARLETLVAGELRADEVLVKIAATGICHTDLVCRDGILPVPRPVVLGHEGAGVVVRVGNEVKALRPGDHVVLTFLPCGECTECRQGVPAYCELFLPGNFTGRRLDGTTALGDGDGEVSGHFFGQSSFASHSIANERNAIKVRADAPLELLGPLGCGVQTGAGAVMNVLRPVRGESLAIFGGGSVGLSAVMAGRIKGCDPIIVVEPLAARRALALELGAHHALDPAAEPELVEALRALTGSGLHHAFDTTGRAELIGQAISALRRRGKIALVSASALDASLPTAILDLVARGITIRGVHMGDSVPGTFIPELVDFIIDGQFPIEKIVRFYGIDQINDAFEDQKRGVVTKPIIRCG